MTLPGPGREIDAVVASQVMGLEVFQDPDGYWMQVIVGMTDYAIRFEVSHYSTDIAAAWLVVEALYAKDFQKRK